ncbi:MAG: dTDP-4-dehydrorhamnose 3,5-epimerase [Kiritimatiellae bacterium]|nr:dTDP-4-dehydrorhamnose 3,5-epimerase [Kiritimatiellia bacterium]
MPLNHEPLAIPDVILVHPRIAGDRRGFFMQSYKLDEYAAAGISCTFVQDNLSHSRMGTLRGMHWQRVQTQDKLVQVVKGAVFDVAVDVRRGSPTFGQWVSAELSEENRAQLFVPKGFAHGFRVLSEEADFYYKCSDFYAPGGEGGFRWDDPDVAIDWGKDFDRSAMLFSDKDMALPFLKDIPEALLPPFSAPGEKL